MGTENISRRYAGLDAWEAADILDGLIEGQMSAVAAVRGARRDIETAALAVEERLRAGAGRLIYAGAGTSGRLAVQDGAELPPTFSWPDDRLLLLIAGGRDALTTAVEGAEDSSERGAELIREHAVDGADVLVGVAASGTTPFTLACLTEAKGRGALTIGIANNFAAPLLTQADHGIWLDTGPEAIAGSTRMKAGTAQKITLNLLSSLVMIRLGRVFDGLMVDVQATNLKLVRRAEDMLMRLTGSGPAEVREALGRSGGNVKLAVLLLRGCEVAEAEAALERSGGQLRSALGLIGARNPVP
ncbi:MAG: N-acetylmuramic acid 6-phosphate etherase [uncultured Microvirga sp.]|uniref:N-acetylmuramic acid 6-phosphate etherase n=1 Tax=uncultured Microvirga sp. TaxID=412392 RepID=A0A6J4M170_9HYPH|nr:MAG: N-acetylmuramic acid 6-phosphate etherase [uncultured Microvirga sp.]